MSERGAPSASAALWRYRVRFAKEGPLRWVGHLDLQRVWLHTLRRAELPLAFNTGFHPRPRLVFAASLPLGFIGKAELLELGLTEERDAAGLHAGLHRCAAPGLRIDEVVAVDADAPALGRGLRAFDYAVTLEAQGDAELDGRIAALLAATSLPRERRRRPYDLRPLIERLTRVGGGALTMRLSAGEGTTGRPDEVLRALGYEPADATIERTALCFEGQR
ncbi:MAG: DUF2344 domain-containing protein [Proteobacteria bacterium]|nr:DUF2344 domain-containing protein [Pseudomonadota bacterium]